MEIVKIFDNMIPKEDLRWYLFEENIDSHQKNGLINYEERVLQHMKKFKSYYFPFRLFGMVSKIFYKLSKFTNQDKSNILVHDYLWKYPSIVNQLQSKYNPIFFGLNIKPFIFSLHKNLHYPLYDVYNSVYAGIINSNDYLLEDSFLRLEKKLKKIDPKLIILDFDHFPETRLMTMVAKKLEIPTIEIQHGIYSGKGKLVSGNYVDYVFVWGEYFKDLYLRNKKNQTPEIRILGYPYSIPYPENMRYNKRIAYLGQALELYGDSFLNTKKDMIQELDSWCTDNGFEFVYKPHRMEDLDLLKKECPQVKFSPKNEKIEDTLINNNVFISFNSTALIESALNSKMSVQLINYDIPTDDFEELGICRSFTSLTELKEFLKELKTSEDVKRHYSPVNPYYIEIPSPSPGEKFVELMREILDF